MSKDKENVVQVDDIISLIENKFDYSNNIINLEDNEIEFVVKNSNYNKSVSVYLSIDGYRESEARILNNCLNILKKGDHRKRYHLTVAYDESSKYMAEKIFPLLSKYERLLRYILYLKFIRSLGNNWMEEIIKNNEKIKDKSSKIESVLEDFNLEDYEYLLFEKVYSEDPTETLKKITEDINSEDFNISEWRKNLDSKKPLSNWERYFNGNNLDCISNNHNSIRKFRNRVMHNKNIDYKAFIKYQKIISEANEQLSATANYIKSGRISTVDISRLEKSFVDLIERSYKTEEMFENLNKVYINSLAFKVENVGKTLLKASESYLNPINKVIDRYENLNDCNNNPDK